MPTVYSYWMFCSLSTPTFPLAYLMVLFASWFLLAWLSLFLSELSFSVNPSCYFNCCLHADAFCISIPCLSSRPPLLAVSDHGYLAHHHVKPTCLKQNFHFSRPGSLLVINFIEELMWVSSLSTSHAVITAYSRLLLTKCTPGKVYKQPQSLPIQSILYTGPPH